MNDTFDLRRFGLYAYKQYRDYAAISLVGITIGAILIMIYYSPIKIFEVVELYKNISASKLLVDKLASFRLITFAVFIIWLGSSNSNNEVKNRALNKDYAMLPISSLERFAFMLLNPIIAGSIIYALVIDPILILYVESHIFIDGSNMIIMPLINKAKYVVDTLTYSNISIDTTPFIFESSSTSIFSPLEYNVFIYSVALLFCSVKIWCDVSFKHNFWGLILHLAIFIGGAFCYHLINTHTLNKFDHIFFDPSVSSMAISPMSLLPLLLASAYIYSAYRKFRRLPTN